MIILGLNAFHADSAAALVRDGVLIAAAEEERFRRIKHWAGFPSAAIAYCLRAAGLTLDDVDHVAVNQDSRVHKMRKIGYVLTHAPNIQLIRDRLRNRYAREGVSEHLARSFPDQRFRGRFHNIEHHLAHLFSAFHVSPFAEAAVVSIDASATFPARLGASAAAKRSESMGGSFSPIRSACSIRHSPNISDFRIMATSTR